MGVLWGSVDMGMGGSKLRGFDPADAAILAAVMP